MKKFMLGAAILAAGTVAAAPSFAREVKEVVGYVKTETVVNSRDALFAEADRNGDGVLSFKEFADASMFENEYMMFKMNDANNDNILDITEFRNFSKQGPQRVNSPFGSTNKNFNNKPIN